MRRNWWVSTVLITVAVASVGAGAAASAVVASRNPPKPASSPSPPMTLAVESTQELPLESLLSRVQTRYRDMNDLRAAFVQRTVARPGLPPREAAGTWYARPPGRIRIEYTVTGRTLVADGETIFWYLPEDRQVQVRSQDSLSLGRTPMLYLTGAGDLVEDFLVSGIDWGEALAPGHVQVRLDPRQPTGDYSYLVFEIDPATALIHRLVSFGLLGESSEYSFADIATDVGLADDVFQFDVPAGVQIENLGN